MQSVQNARDKIKVADVAVSINHVTFLTNRFPRLISLLTSTIVVSGTSGITAILKYGSVTPIHIFYYYSFPMIGCSTTIYVGSLLKRQMK